jgi:hypothetical protein
MSRYLPAPAAVKAATAVKATMELATPVEVTMEPVTVLKTAAEAVMEAVGSAGEPGPVEAPSVEPGPVEPTSVEPTRPVEAARPVEAMEPGASADENAANKPIRPIVAVGRARIGVISIVAISAYGRRADVAVTRADSDADDYSLCMRERRAKQVNSEQAESS